MEENSNSNSNSGTNEGELFCEVAPWKIRPWMVKLINISQIHNIFKLILDRGFGFDFAVPTSGDSVIVAFREKHDLDIFLNGDWRVMHHIIYEFVPLAADFVSSV